MRICVILEGCYPYVTGGVSTWIHQYMSAMPQHEFVIWAIGADSSMKGKYKYTLPENVVEIHEVFLNDALTQKGIPKRYKFSMKEIKTLRDFVNCDSPDWDLLLKMYSQDRIDPVSFLMSEEFLNILINLCEDEYPYTAFSDFFHTVRSMFLPVLYLLSMKAPRADLFHSIATGYGGLLARLGSYKFKVPYMITEHGIYTREREEEIIRAKWVIPAFKKLWVRFFYMLSECAYDKASMVTSLYSDARKIQIEMGCDPDKCVFIGNGIHYERFKDIPMKGPSDHIDMGAVLRIAPIKDVKTMIYAFAGCKERVPNARLFIAGPEDDKQYAKECYDLVDLLEVDDVYFMGPINVVKHLGDFDFTILSSVSEGMPLSVLESFAAGRPCVTTDVGSCKELLAGSPEDDFGMAGICVPPMDIPELTNALIQMCLKPEMRYQMGIAGRNRVAKFFLHDDMIRKYQSVYDEVFKRWQGLASV